jgi:hypothetical protein
MRPALFKASAGVVSVALAVLAALLVMGSSTSPSIPGVTNLQLARGGIVLSSGPLLSNPKVSRSQAERLAAAYVGDRGAAVKGSTLARFHYIPNPSIDCLCWVVSVLPAGTGGFSQPEGSGPVQSRVAYFLVFVDSQSGRIGFSREVGR